MRPKGLTESEITQIINFDWNNSDDEEGEEEEELYDSNLERVIEDTIDQVRTRGENVELNLITRIVEKDVHGEADEIVENEGDTENIVTESFEKINLESLRWRNASLSVCETAWKEETIYREVRDPIKYFSEFFDDEIINKICNETNLYSMQTKGVVLNCFPFEIRRFFGVLLYLGVIQVPNLRMAWMPNFRLSAVADSLSRVRFEKIKEAFHINDNTQQPERGSANYDKLYKIRPLLDKMKEKCNKINQEEHQSIDEQMIKYKGRHNLKQYLPMKPNKWGFKMFTRAGVSGIVYDFALYAGEGTCPSFGLGISSDIVLHLASNVRQHKNYKLYFDNWFTSISLMIALKEKGILAVGTIRSNRMKNCCLMNEKELMKKGRGSYDFKFEVAHNLVVCRWYDNKSVQLVSNYIAEKPVSECKRWCRKEKKYLNIPRPAIVECYNKHMGGVDLADMLLDLYKINHRSKKWYMRIVYWCLSTAVVNSWLLYRRDLKNHEGRTKHMSLLNFQLMIANELLHDSDITPVHQRKRGRPLGILSSMHSNAPSPVSPAPSNISDVSLQSSSSSAKRSYIAEPPKSMRLDQTSHWVEWGAKGRCRLCHTGIPKSKCSKCK
ncbi:PREDICTED: piggyBac transposable element-derived protein 3-like, partial [Dufourea novaeangliae]|uniref:piggyBac transposable element-derived protein 3-like n=1 Tax=Dufourea novaeangliae TaxID=178035 RepID=UPI000767382C